MGITPGTRQAIRSSDMLLRGLFPAPPVRHRAEGGNGGGELVAASSGSLPRDMMFTEGLAPLFSHANNLIRLILSHRPMPVVNRGATNAQIARLPTHTLPRTTTSGVRRGKGTGRKRKAPGEVPVPSNAESENADVKAMAVGQHNASSSSSSRGCVAAAATSGDDPNLNMPDRSSVAATAAEGGLDACTICMEDYKGGEKLCTLPCSHVYHFKVREDTNGWVGDPNRGKIYILSCLRCELSLTRFSSTPPFSPTVLQEVVEDKQYLLHLPGVN